MLKECKYHGLTSHAIRMDRGRERLRCHKCNVEATKRRRKKQKLDAIAYKGGCCQECGYTGDPAVFEFHHLDPKLKDFEIGLGSKSWEKTKVELDKCAILCANCHREVHSGFRMLL